MLVISGSHYGREKNEEIDWADKSRSGRRWSSHHNDDNSRTKTGRLRYRGNILLVMLVNDVQVDDSK